MAADTISLHRSLDTPITWQTIIEFNLPSVPGFNTQAANHVIEVIEGGGLPIVNLEQLRSSLNSAIQRASETSQNNSAEDVLNLRVLRLEKTLHRGETAGGQRDQRETEPTDQPQSQCCGYFIIEKEVAGIDGVIKHILELYLYS